MPPPKRAPRNWHNDHAGGQTEHPGTQYATLPNGCADNVRHTVRSWQSSTSEHLVARAMRPEIVGRPNVDEPRRVHDRLETIRLC